MLDGFRDLNGIGIFGENGEAYSSRRKVPRLMVGGGFVASAKTMASRRKTEKRFFEVLDDSVFGAKNINGSMIDRRSEVKGT